MYNVRLSDAESHSCKEQNTLLDVCWGLWMKSPVNSFIAAPKLRERISSSAKVYSLVAVLVLGFMEE